MQKPFQSFNFFYQDGTFLFFVDLCWEGYSDFCYIFSLAGWWRKMWENYSVLVFFNKSLLLKVLWPNDGPVCEHDREYFKRGFLFVSVPSKLRKQGSQVCRPNVSVIHVELFHQRSSRKSQKKIIPMSPATQMRRCSPVGGVASAQRQLWE